MTQGLFGLEEPDKLISNRSMVRSSHDLVSNWFSSKSEVAASSSVTTSPTFTDRQREEGSGDGNTLWLALTASQQSGEAPLL